MNYVSLLGRLTRDPEISYTQTEKAFLRFSIAVPRDTNKDEVDFINCIAWEKRAETIAQYFKKGNRILISGRLLVGSYEKNGEKRTTVDVVVNSFDFIETKSDGEGRTRHENVQTTSSSESFPFDDDDDDLPF